MVYAIPPSTKNIIPPGFKFSMSGLMAKIMAHPMAMYATTDIFLNFFKSIAFKTMPRIAAPQIIPNKVQPIVPSMLLKHKEYMNQLLVEIYYNDLKCKILFSHYLLSANDKV